MERSESSWELRNECVPNERGILEERKWQKKWLQAHSQPPKTKDRTERQHFERNSVSPVNTKETIADTLGMRNPVALGGLISYEIPEFKNMLCSSVGKAGSVARNPIQKAYMREIQ